MYIYNNLFAIHQKLAQYCKPAMLQLKTRKKMSNTGELTYIICIK